MTINKTLGQTLRFKDDIEAEFGAQSPRSLGSYRHSQTVGGLTFDGIDGGIPSGPNDTIKFSDFYGKSLNIVVDCFSGSDEFRISAKNNKWNNNEIVIINPSTVSKKESGTKIIIRVNKKFGSDKSGINNCALKTGSWNNPAVVVVDLGSNAKILGAGGDGGRGADGTTNPGQDGGDGSSGLGIEHQGTIVNYRSGSVIRAGFAGGGGGGGGRETSKNDRRAGGGGGGGGAGFPFGLGGAGGTPLGGVDRGGSSIGGDGGNGTETTGGNGGSGGDNEDQAGGQTGGVGGDNEQSPGNGPDGDNDGGDGGTNGAAIRKSSGVSFGFAIQDGTLQGNTNASGVA